MAGWSMVANEDDFTDSGFEKKIKELVSLFRSLLESFLDEFCSSDSFRPLPPMIGDGRPVCLFNLFLNVTHRGGFDVVTKNGLWEQVGQESGLGFGNSPSAKLIYVKYLDSLVRWLNRVIAGDDDDGGGGACVELCGVSDDLKVRLKVFLSEVKRKYEVRKGGKGSKELGVEFKWFVSKMKRRYEKYQIGKETVGNDGVKVILDSGNQDGSSPRKRKRECSLETLKWLSRVAEDPCDTSIGSLPDISKWGSYGSEEPWRELLLFRASRTKSDSATDKNWQKLQKMHPSLYDDSGGPSYNLRERLSFDSSQFNEKKAGKGKTSSGNGSASDSDEEDRPCPLIGSEFQAEVPEWTDITTESDTKWLGTRIWPLSNEQNKKNLLIERDPIGKGRQDLCGCQNPGSVECVRFHIATKQEKLKLELGPAFYMWCFDIMGEGVLQYWTELEQKKVKTLMTSPPTLSPSFFDQIKRILSSKSRGKIVSYFYNVTVLQFRANQSRTSPYEIDSDTDNLYNIATQNENPSPEANTSQKPVLLSPKKKRRR